LCRYIVVMPQHISREGKDFMRGALAMKPEERLTVGAGGGSFCFCFLETEKFPM
jgi:hypothetical protein